MIFQNTPEHTKAQTTGPNTGPTNQTNKEIKMKDSLPKLHERIEVFEGSGVIGGKDNNEKVSDKYSESVRGWI